MTACLVPVSLCPHLDSQITQVHNISTACRGCRSGLLPKHQGGLLEGRLAAGTLSELQVLWCARLRAWPVSSDCGHGRHVLFHGPALTCTLSALRELTSCTHTHNCELTSCIHIHKKSGDCGQCGSTPCVLCMHKSQSKAIACDHRSIRCPR